MYIHVLRNAVIIKTLIQLKCLKSFSTCYFSNHIILKDLFLDFTVEIKVITILCLVITIYFKLNLVGLLLATTRIFLLKGSLTLIISQFNVSLLRFLLSQPKMLVTPIGMIATSILIFCLY